MASEDADATRSQAPQVQPEAVTITLEPGERLDDEPESYEVEAHIGAGGMGTVVAAKGKRFARAVALKTLAKRIAHKAKGDLDAVTAKDIDVLRAITSS